MRSEEPRIRADSDELSEGLGQLVVTVLDVVRELLERQVLRRVEAGTLNEDEIERLGRALIDLDTRFDELRAKFEEGTESNDDRHVNTGH